jgi:hypothetical protein
MTDDPWDKYRNPSNVDPRAGAPQLPRWITLIPVDHDPFETVPGKPNGDPWARFADAPEADGGDLSSAASRRLPGERAQPPSSTGTPVGYPQEDIEARAWAPRTGLEPIPFGNAAVGISTLVAAPFKAAWDTAHGVAESAERPRRQGYHPEIDDEQYKRQAAADAFNVAGLAGTGGFAGSAAVADAGSLGTFIGKVAPSAWSKPDSRSPEKSLMRRGIWMSSSKLGDGRTRGRARIKSAPTRTR